eukprot:m.82933 g.82933  ORF g.82933 m.82933 type:complete len:462 (-) comp12705_c0_seq4:808-2193(-)
MDWLSLVMQRMFPDASPIEPFENYLEVIPPDSDGDEEEEGEEGANDGCNEAEAKEQAPGTRVDHSDREQNEEDKRYLQVQALLGQDPVTRRNHSPIPRQVRRRFWGLGMSHRKFRILSLDGQGASMMYVGRVLQRLEAVTSEHFVDHFELIAGTSGGAVTALLLGCGYSVDGIVELYRRYLPSVLSATGIDWRAYWPFRSRFGERRRRKMFERFFGDRKLKDMRIFVMVTAFNMRGITPTSQHTSTSANASEKASAGLDQTTKEPDKESSCHFHEETQHDCDMCGRWHPEVFSNLPDDESRELSLVEVAMRVTASPSYLPIHNGYVDGVIGSSNPSFSALSWAMRRLKTTVTLDNSHILSIGGPLTMSALPASNLDWGIWQWVPWLVSKLHEEMYSLIKGFICSEPCHRSAQGAHHMVPSLGTGMCVRCFKWFTFCEGVCAGTEAFLCDLHLLGCSERYVK